MKQEIYKFEIVYRTFPKNIPLSLGVLSNPKTVVKEGKDKETVLKDLFLENSDLNITVTKIKYLVY